MPKLVKKSAKIEPDYFPKTRRAASLASDFKADDILAYDVQGLTLIADSFVICSARSEPQMKAIANGVRDGMKEVGVRALHTEGTPQDGWLVLDFGDVIFHVFRTEARKFYDLDGLWADAPRIDLNLE